MNVSLRIAVAGSLIGLARFHPLRQGARLRLCRGVGQFRHAIAVAVLEDGAEFVADFQNNRTQKWRPNANK